MPRTICRQSRGLLVCGCAKLGYAAMHTRQLSLSLSPSRNIFPILSQFPSSCAAIRSQKKEMAKFISHSSHHKYMRATQKTNRNRYSLMRVIDQPLMAVFCISRDKLKNQRTNDTDIENILWKYCSKFVSGLPSYRSDRIKLTLRILHRSDGINGCKKKIHSVYGKLKNDVMFLCRWVWLCVSPGLCASLVMLICKFYGGATTLER